MRRRNFCGGECPEFPRRGGKWRGLLRRGRRWRICGEGGEEVGKRAVREGGGGILRSSFFGGGRWCFSEERFSVFAGVRAIFGREGTSF